MDIRAEEISKFIRDQIGSYAVEVDVAEVGTVVSVGDGIARVHGIERAMAGEMLEFPHGVLGLALNLEEESVGAVLLGEYREISEGDVVKRTGRIISVPVGEGLSSGARAPDVSGQRRGEAIWGLVPPAGQPECGPSESAEHLGRHRLGPVQQLDFLPVDYRWGSKPRIHRLLNYRVIVCLVQY